MTGAADPLRAAAPAGAERWLLAHREGTSLDAALAFVDRLPGVGVPALTGRWCGAGWHTGHPWDGLLEAYGWWGKEFLDAERVRPTLFRDAAGNPHPVDPVVAPVGLIDALPAVLRHPVVGAGFRLLRPLLTSGRPAGRLRVVEHRGTPTAALVYDRVPIIDAFRRVTDDLLVGVADIRGQDAPLLFVLRRAGVPGRGASSRAGHRAGASGARPAALAGSAPLEPLAPAPPAPPRAPGPPAPPTGTARHVDPPPAVARWVVGGRVPVLPRRRRDREEVLGWVASRVLPLHEPVTERALTDRLSALTHDPVGLRRELVDCGLVDRTRDGAEYWRTRVTGSDSF